MLELLARLQDANYAYELTSSFIDYKPAHNAKIIRYSEAPFGMVEEWESEAPTLQAAVAAAADKIPEGK